jgi:hypothetical protein
LLFSKHKWTFFVIDQVLGWDLGTSFILSPLGDIRFFFSIWTVMRSKFSRHTQIVYKGMK